MSAAIPTKARQVVGERDGRLCLACGSPGTALHHRQRRREGGHGYENLITLCHSDHSRAHSNPAWARERGFIVSVSVDDISQVPLKMYGGWILLDTEGSYRYITEQEVEAQWALVSA